MSRLRAVLAALMLGAPFVASAAEVTRVASSFEDDDPFGMFIDVGFERTAAAREDHSARRPQGGAVDASRRRALATGAWTRG